MKTTLRFKENIDFSNEPPALLNRTYFVPNLGHPASLWSPWSFMKINLGFKTNISFSNEPPALLNRTYSSINIKLINKT